VKISKDVIEHVANLARLEITEEEKLALTMDMEQIISYVDKLNELDTSQVKPTNHVISITNVFREDKSAESYSTKKILQNAPSSEKGCFKVPKIVE